MSLHDTAIKTSYFSIFGNILLAIIKAIAGIFGQSYALIADAIESANDVFASIIVMLGLRYAKLPPDENHPYGHGKIEPLITFIVVGLLVFSAIYIAYESVLHILEPDTIPKSWTLWVLAGIIVWKEASYQFVIKRSKETNSSALKADAWHHRSDAITSVTAFIGISLAIYLGESFKSADDWAALFAAAVILFNSYRIFRPALAEVMDEHRYDELEAKIRLYSTKVAGIRGTEKCHIRKHGMHFQIDLHAIVDGTISVNEGHRIAHELQDYLIKKIPHINQVLVHIEPDVSHR